jgi:hypothetical protein
MTFNELMKRVLDIFPNAQIDEDMDGQIVIYTNLMLNENNETVSFEPPED